MFQHRCRDVGRAREVGGRSRERCGVSRLDADTVDREDETVTTRRTEEEESTDTSIAFTAIAVVVCLATGGVILAVQIVGTVPVNPLLVGIGVLNIVTACVDLITLRVKN